jgi:hypothetical protein
MEVMIVNRTFSTEVRTFNPGDVFVSTPHIKQKLTHSLKLFAAKVKQPSIVDNIRFQDIDTIFKKATKKGGFKHLLILRSGGIGDLIALTSIIDYFEGVKIHFATQGKYFALFDWFVEKPVLYDITSPIIKNYKSIDCLTRFQDWARFQGEGIIEAGDHRNWMEIFFEFIGEKNMDTEFLRPQLRTDRLNNYELSNINILSTGKKALLICNKASAMMRTCNVHDIYFSLPKRILNEFSIFAYKDNCSPEDLKKLSKTDIVLIEKTDLRTYLLDCFDADNLISVDTGALHFREATNKPAIGLYNSFTTESRTKHYKYTKSFDIKSPCKIQPCFIHETIERRFCPVGNKNMYTAPCFDSKYNKDLLKQFREIFENL